MVEFIFFPKAHMQFWNFVPLLGGEAIPRKLECKKKVPMPQCEDVPALAVLAQP